MTIKRISTIIFFIFHSFLLIAGSDTINALMEKLEQAKTDTVRIETLLDLAWEYQNSNPKKGLEYAERAKNLASSIDNEKGIANSLSHMSTNYVAMSEYKEALDAELAALIINKKLNNKRGIAKSYLNIGIVNYYLQDYDETIENWDRAVRIYKRLDDSSSQRTVLNNLGSVYRSIRDFDKAIECFTKAMNLSSGEDEISRAEIYNNLGNTYNDLSKFQNEESNIQKALLYLDKAARIFRKNDMKLYYGYTLLNKSSIYSDQGKLSLAKEKALMALDIFLEVDSKEDINQAYENLAEIHTGLHDYEEAYRYLDSNFVLTMELRGEASSKALAELETRYKTRNKVRENELLKKENALKQSQLEKQQWIRYAMTGGIITLLVIMGMVFVQFYMKKKANDLLNIQNEEISFQKQQIEYQHKELATKNKELLSSIQYARRIQEAIMPPVEMVNTCFPDSFVYYKPKDIVSGDFYWIEIVGKKIFWAVVDCTGHGVSGAFMSILGVNGLKKIILDRGIHKPSQILHELTDYVINSLHESKKGISVKDGMDMALCCLDTETNTLEYAGAYNPLFIVQDNKLELIRGTRRPVGSTIYEEPPDFENHTIKLNKGDCLYVSSDGLIDQFGEETGMKFSYKRLRALIQEEHRKPMQEQCAVLDQAFNEWKGAEEQIDDICVFGVRV